MVNNCINVLNFNYCRKCANHLLRLLRAHILSVIDTENVFIICCYYRIPFERVYI